MAIFTIPLMSGNERNFPVTDIPPVSISVEAADDLKADRYGRLIWWLFVHACGVHGRKAIDQYQLFLAGLSEGLVFEQVPSGFTSVSYELKTKRGDNVAYLEVYEGRCSYVLLHDRDSYYSSSPSSYLVFSMDFTSKSDVFSNVFLEVSNYLFLNRSSYGTPSEGSPSIVINRDAVNPYHEADPSLEVFDTILAARPLSVSYLKISSPSSTHIVGLTPAFDLKDTPDLFSFEARDTVFPYNFGEYKKFYELQSFVAALQPFILEWNDAVSVSTNDGFEFLLSNGDVISVKKVLCKAPLVLKGVSGDRFEGYLKVIKFSDCELTYPSLERLLGIYSCDFSHMYLPRELFVDFTSGNAVYNECELSCLEDILG